MAELLFYQRVVALNEGQHKDLRLKPLSQCSAAYGFARTANSVPIVPVELAEVAREYPIGFVVAPDGGYLPVALLGLRDQENLFVTPDGMWSAHYIPAFVRRYPFVPATGPKGDLLVGIDAEAECLRGTEGEALFVDGKPGKALEQAMGYLREFHAAGVAGAAASKRLAARGLLREVGTLAQLPNGERFQLSGLHVIDEEKLRALDQSAVFEMFKSGDLQLVYAHLMSLGNLQRLVDRLVERLNLTPKPAASGAA